MEKTSITEIRKHLRCHFDPIRTASIVATYSQYYRRADNEDRQLFTKSIGDMIKQCADNGKQIGEEEAYALAAMAASHHQICEAYCNRNLTPVEEALQEKIEEVLAAIFADSQIKTGSQSDPRGLTLKLFLPSKRYNSWDGESWRIPMP